MLHSGCVGCADDIRSGVLCADCDAQGWYQEPCGCVFDPCNEVVVECDDCEMKRSEEREQRFVEAFHGGIAPQSVYDATYQGSHR